MISNNNCCQNMAYYIQNEVVSYNEVFDEYGIIVHEDDVSTIIIEYCPWCGKKLPISQRNTWFDELEKKGFFSPLFDENIPIEYRSKKWREKH